MHASVIYYVNFRLQDFLDYLPPSEMAKADSAQVNSETGDGKLKNPRSRAARSRAANVVSGDYFMAIYYGMMNRDSLQDYLGRMRVYPSATIAKPATSKKKSRGFKGLPNFDHLVLLEPNVSYTTGNDVKSQRDPYDEANKREELVSYWKISGRVLDVKVDVVPTSTGVAGLSTDIINRQMIIND